MSHRAGRGQALTLPQSRDPSTWGKPAPGLWLAFALFHLFTDVNVYFPLTPNAYLKSKILS